MNRAIKFRAWDKSKNCWEHRFRIDSDGGVIVHRPSDKEPWVLEWREFSDYELMQYTGLKDKNGTEIYEGDIVRVKYRRDDSSFIAPVQWGEYSFDGYYGMVGFNLDYPCEVSFDSQECNRFEVIGNVFENGDLLNESKEVSR